MPPEAAFATDQLGRVPFRSNGGEVDGLTANMPQQRLIKVSSLMPDDQLLAASQDMPEHSSS